MTVDTLGMFRIAEQLSIPQIVQSLQNGTIDNTIGQLVLNNKMQQQKKMKQAQATQQPPRPPIAQENMAEGQMMSGVARVPAEVYQDKGMFGGGIVGYAEGGPVSSFDRDVDSVKDFTKAQALKVKLAARFRGQMGIPGYFSKLSPEDKAAMEMLEQRLPFMSLQELKQIDEFGLKALKGIDPKAVMPRGESPFAKKLDLTSLMTPPRQEEPPASSPAGGPSIPGASVPGMNLRGYDEIMAGMGDRAGRMSALSKQREAELGVGDKEAFQGIKDIIAKQKGTIADVDKKNLYLSLIKGGLAAAGGDSQYALQNIARGGEAGVESYIQRDVLNRANQNQIANSEQMMRLQELSAAKGNRSMADKYAQGIAGLEQGDAQLKMGATNAANQTELQKAGLGLQAAQINQQGAIQRANIDSRNQYYKARGDEVRARQMGLMQKAAAEFMEGPGKSIEATLQKKYGANWSSIPEAQMTYNNNLKAYVARRAEAMEMMVGGGGMGGMGGGVPSFEQLMEQE